MEGHLAHCILMILICVANQKKVCIRLVKGFSRVCKKTLKVNEYKRKVMVVGEESLWCRIVMDGESMRLNILMLYVG